MTIESLKELIIMKIATYNVWSEHLGRGNRFAQLINEIMQMWIF